MCADKCGLMVRISILTLSGENHSEQTARFKSRFYFGRSPKTFGTRALMEAPVNTHQLLKWPKVTTTCTVVDTHTCVNVAVV